MKPGKSRACPHAPGGWLSPARSSRAGLAALVLIGLALLATPPAHATAWSTARSAAAATRAAATITAAVSRTARRGTTRRGTTRRGTARRGTARRAATTSTLSASARFNRLTFDNTPSSSDSHLSVAVVEQSYTVSSYIAQLRRNAPGIKVVAYQALWWMRPADKLGTADCLPGGSSYQESWYLHNGKGQREAWNPGTTAVKYGMDFANSGYLQACAQHIVSVAKAIGADGVFLDGAPSSVHWAQLPTACTPSPPAAATCASDANFQKAMTAALAYVTATLHAHGLLTFVNISGGNVTFCCGGGPAIWQRYVAQVDGAMQESWTYGTNHLPLPATEVQAGLANTAWSEAHGKYTLVNDDITNCESCSDYGLATMMLVAGGLSSYDISNGVYSGTTNGLWWPSYSTAQGVGAPLGPYRTLADGLMVRSFASGSVVVNDTTSAISDPTYGRVPPTSAQIR